MIVGFDTNILVYAHREETPYHKAAKSLLIKYAEGNKPWAIAWPCIYEFLRIVTHVKVFHPPTPTPLAWESVTSLLSAPSLLLLTETERHQHILSELLKATSVKGNLIHDAHIAALFIEYGIQEIFTLDEDFRRFSPLKATNPFHN